MDYYYYIKGCSLSTFHRDVMSGQKYFNTKHPTYTVIIMNMMAIFYQFVLFNADMLHCGTINKISNNRKVLHFKFKELNTINLEKNSDCNIVTSHEFCLLPSNAKKENGWCW